MNHGINKGWINEREEKKVGKGRPYKIYSLGFNQFIGAVIALIGAIIGRKFIK